MKTTALITAALLVMALLGCATPYRPMDIKGGYTHTQLGAEIYRVTFRGNFLLAHETARDYALLRSAELAVENGFSHLVIIDERNTPNTDAGTGAGLPTSTVTVSMSHDKPSEGIAYDAVFLAQSIRSKYGL